MADGKWINQLTADMPVVEAARHVFAVRLAVVRDCLPPALHAADTDPEHIHQLRVSTRRAGAAVRTFALCLPHKSASQLRKKLRKLRRAAGAARDWDVFGATVVARLGKIEAKQRPGLDFLVGYSQGQRAAARDALLAAFADPVAAMDQLLAATDAALRSPEEAASPATLGELATPTLTTLLRELEEAAAQDLHPYPHLHRVRILGKRLRYAMEIFAPCYQKPFREDYYVAVEEMQEILGHANDSYMAVQQLTALSEHLQVTQPTLWPSWQAGIRGLLQFHQRRLPQQRRKFLKWWCQWQDLGAAVFFAQTP